MEELGDFLRSRRSRLSPEDAGVRTYGERRRVPGLRREELAQLAGVSVAYYTRLEQGLSKNASDGVLDAIARALRLDADETAHLNALAHPPRPAAHAGTGPRPRQERVRPSVRTMLAALGDVPAILVGYRNDVLAWNPMGHALLFGHLPFDAPDRAETRPNTFWLVFCDPHMRELYADWKKKAQHAVADLRLISGRYPGDPQLTSLIGELSVHSQEFARLWAVHPVRQCRATVRGFRHPLVGALTLNSEVMELVPDTGQRLFIYSAEPDSPSDAALRLLAGLTAENAAEAESAEDAAQHAPSGQHSVRAHPLPRSDPADLSLDAMWVPRTVPVLGWVRICRRSELSSAAAITVIAVTAIGAGKLTSSATSWNSAAPTAQASTAAAAQSSARRTISRAFARTPAMPLSHAAFAFSLMTMAAIAPPRLLNTTSYAERDWRRRAPVRPDRRRVLPARSTTRQPLIQQRQGPVSCLRPCAFLPAGLADGNGI